MIVCSCLKAFGLWPGSSKGPHETLPLRELRPLLWGGSAPCVRHCTNREQKDGAEFAVISSLDPYG